MEQRSRSLDAAIGRFTEAFEADDVTPAIDALAAQRGGDGVALGDALDDFATVHRIVTGEEPTRLGIRRFAIGWSEAAHGAFLARGALDHSTGLATTDYLATRLRDLARTGRSGSRRLVVAPAAPEGASHFTAMLRGARVARTLIESFPDAETPVGLPLGRVGALVPHEHGLRANAIRAAIAVGAVDGTERAEITTIELPDVEDTVPAFVDEL